ncbi:syntaxin binding protein 1 [Coemansia sp. RSA 1804]|nr:syntaxin binding protein 1 [Coemansia sp. RSA 1804]
MGVNLEENKRQARFKILVVDKRSLQILNKALKLSEILEHDILRIEKIENNRKDEPGTEALYFLTPSRQSVLRLIDDFPSQQQHRAQPHKDARGRPTGAPSGPPTGGSGRKEPRYRCAHVFFTSELSTQLFKLIKGSGVTRYIKALKEMCIEYDVYDSHVFLTKLLNYPLYRLYSPLLAGTFNDELEMISKKLTNVCGVLKENPVVRYLLLDQETYGDTKARPLAFLFHTEMDRIRESLPQDSENNARPQSELIIIDRSADPFAPILHEFTYEAMVYDLLKVDGDGQVTYTAELGDGSTETKTIKLSDSDPIWEEFRFQHISDAQEGILKKFNELVGSNKSITEMQSGKMLNLSKMRDVINRLPQYKDQMGVISAHITIMQDCMSQFNERYLNDLGMIQQNIVTGTTPDGEKYAAGDIDIADVLNNPDIRPKDKLRTLLIFFISNPSLTERERQKLAHMARFSREAREAIKNMGMVIRWAHALDLLKQLKERPTKASKPGKWGFGAIGGGSNHKEDEGAKPYDLSRYAPAVKNVLEDCVAGKLSEDMFPYVVPPERPYDTNPLSNPSLRNAGLARSAGTPGQSGDRTSSPASSMWTSIANSVGFNTQDSRPSSGQQDSGSATPRQIKSLRSGRPTWQKRDSAPGMVHSNTAPSAAFGDFSTNSPSPSASQSPPTNSGSYRHAQPRIIIYVIGGVTYSEVRVAEEVARKHGREVLVGSTHVLSPSAYLREISSLSFEISDDHGRVLNMKPSYYRLGYGGPPDLDPLSTYDENLDKPQPKPSSKASVNASAASDASGMSGSAGSSNNYSRSASREGGRNGGGDPREHTGSQSRESNSGGSSSNSRRPDPRNMPSGGRPYPGDSQPRPIASHGSMRSGGGGGGGGGRSISEGPPSNSRPPHTDPQFARDERSASPSVHRDAERGYRAGYDEYRIQQKQEQQIRQQQQAMRSKSSNSSFGHPSRSGTPQGMQQQPSAPRHLSKEEEFRAKFERSKHEWDMQKNKPSSVNPSAISEMHKVSLNPGSGSGGRGRSGSTSSSSEKPRFLKRYL